MIYTFYRDGSTTLIYYSQVYNPTPTIIRFIPVASPPQAWRKIDENKFISLFVRVTLEVNRCTIKVKYSALSSFANVIFCQLRGVKYIVYLAIYWAIKVVDSTRISFILSIFVEIHRCLNNVIFVSICLYHWKLNYIE